MQLTGVLGWLWDTIADPVISRLGLTVPHAADQPWPRIWWCLPGMLSFLPMHAAGHHDDPYSRSSVIDHVVSSCTPTIRALLHARSVRPGNAFEDRQVAAIAMPTTPNGSDLPGAQAEADLLLQRFSPQVRTLIGSHATRAAVIELLQSARWAHFACHASANPTDPSASCLLLADHQRLTVSHIAQLRLHDSEFAYLSACSTAQPGTRLPDEAIHLASAFQLAGYQHVIGTLWPIADDAAVVIASDVYTALARSQSTASAAFALHDAIRSLRDQQPHEPIAWASHIHSGP
jgi:CHAT domain-containing protein